MFSISHDLFDLDLQISEKDGSVEPDVTSKSLCTPGCKDGTGKSFCCSKFGMCE